MIIVFKQDKYVASTWGAADHFKAGEPKEVGDDFGLLCLQNGAEVYKEEKPKAKPEVKKSEVKKKSKK